MRNEALNLILAVSVFGCGSLRVQEVRVPVPVPCLREVPAAEALPVDAMAATERERLVAAGEYQVLADRLAATVLILKAERERNRALLWGCVDLTADP